MNVRIQLARYGGKYYVRIGLTSARVFRGHVELKPRHLKLLGFVGRKGEDYVLLGGRTLVHACRDGMFITIKDLPIPGFPAHNRDFEWSGEIKVN